MSSKVYFIPINQQDSISEIKEKVSVLLDKSKLLESNFSEKKAIIKLHFGEEGNKGYVNPEFVGVISRKVGSAGGSVVLSDSNTLYQGRRVTNEGHKILALEHGFTKEITGAEVVIANESPDTVKSIPVNLQYIKNAKIPECYINTDLFISVAHFKGHMMAGFGGSLKNIGMGCATREGKLAQHSNISPMIMNETCTGCGSCVNNCQVKAITLIDKTASIDSTICTGCASCIAVCKFGAVSVDWGGGSASMQEKMIEYASAVLNNVPRALYINFAIKITAECDCMAQDDPRIADDIGIFISDDPVAVDQACYDLVKKRESKDVFKIAHPKIDSNKQLAYAEQLKLGSRQYTLVNIYF
jgi:uncharacterized Fe-S center protein